MPSAPARHVRRVGYKFHTTDVRRYAVADTVRRARAAVVRAGGVHCAAGARSAPTHVKRWCVLRSPHVNKTSREHFWKLTRRIAFDWDAEAGVVPDEAEFDIVAALPANVATRITVDSPAILRLRRVWDTMNAAPSIPPPAETAADEPHKSASVGLASVV
jgi:ribosomal protein S10